MYAHSLVYKFFQVVVKKYKILLVIILLQTYFKLIE